MHMICLIISLENYQRVAFADGFHKIKIILICSKISAVDIHFTVLGI